MNKTRRGTLFTIIIIAVTLLVSCAAFFASTSAPTLVASVDRQNISTGDTVNYRLAINAGNDADISSDYPDAAVENFVVRNKNIVHQAGLFRSRTEYRYALTQYKPGEYYIQAVTIQYAKPGYSSKYSMRVQGFRIKVDSSLRSIEPAAPVFTFEGSMAGKSQSSSGDAKGRSGPVRYSIQDTAELKEIVTYRGMAVIALSVALGIAVIFFLLFLALKYRLKKKIKHPALPHEIALAKLRRLLDRRLMEKGQAGEFCLEVSGIMKEYVRSRFGMGPGMMTTMEFLEMTEKIAALTSAQKKYLKDLVIVCDLAKYARYDPKEGELDPGLEREKRFIEETMPSDVSSE